MGAFASYASSIVAARSGSFTRLIQGAAVLLVGGDKSGKGGWYDEFVRLADRLYDDHLAARTKKG
jgi:hypothetical protein